MSSITSSSPLIGAAEPSRPLAQLAWAAAGPAALGIALAPTFGLGGLIAWGAGMPAMALGVSLLMLPSLYIAGAVLGVAPPARELAWAALSALGGAGKILAGLAPGCAFLAATSQDPSTRELLAFAAWLGVALIAFAHLYREGMSRAQGSPLAQLAVPIIYGAWSILTAAIGWHFLGRLFA